MGFGTKNDGIDLWPTMQKGAILWKCPTLLTLIVAEAIYLHLLLVKINKFDHSSLGHCRAS